MFFILYPLAYVWIKNSFKCVFRFYKNIAMDSTITFHFRLLTVRPAKLLVGVESIPGVVPDVVFWDFFAVVLFELRADGLLFGVFSGIGISNSSSDASEENNHK